MFMLLVLILVMLILLMLIEVLTVWCWVWTGLDLDMSTAKFWMIPDFRGGGDHSDREKNSFSQDVADESPVKFWIRKDFRMKNLKDEFSYRWNDSRHCIWYPWIFWGVRHIHKSFALVPRPALTSSAWQRPLIGLHFITPPTLTRDRSKKGSRVQRSDRWIDSGVKEAKLMADPTKLRPERQVDFITPTSAAIDWR